MVSIIIYVATWILLKGTEAPIPNRHVYKRHLDLENKQINTFLLSSSTEVSEKACAKTCGNTKDCESFFYDTGTGNCDLRDALFISPSNATEYQGMRCYVEMKGEFDWCPSWKGFTIDTILGLCVKYMDTPGSWYFNNDECVASRPHARFHIIKDAAGQTRLENYMNAHGYTLATFLGLREVSQNVFKWVDGSDITYANWHTADYSDPAMDDCVHIVSSGLWVKDLCTKNRRALCEMTPDVDQYLRLMDFL